MKQWILVWCLMEFVGQAAVAQQQASRWYFGNNAGLTFANGAATAVTDGKLATREGCAGICDAQGKLLFYTDGITVWNGKHAVMQNGTRLLGDSSSTQSSIVVPQPGNDSTYYVFTVDREGRSNGLCYSVINIRTNGGLGTVISKNNLLTTPVTEKLTAVLHANGRDIWVITHEWQNNVFRSYLITEDGIDLHPASQVRSAAGMVHEGDSRNRNAIGYLKASPDGTRLALGIYKKNIYELFDFDNQTGEVSKPVTFTSPLISNAYGVEFSPDGTKLYVNSSGSAAHPNARIYQIDLQQSSQLTLVATSASQYAGALQAGPDGKIYFARFDSLPPGGSYLGVIEQPNQAGVACGYVDNGIYLNGRRCTLGLPSFIQSYFYQPLFTANPTCSGEPMQLSVTDSLQMEQVTWRFGGSTSDPPQISTSASVTHVFSTPGEYPVHVSVTYRNGTVRSAKSNVTVLPAPVVHLGSDTTLCSGKLILNARQPGASYHWQDGSTNDRFIVSQPGTYWVEVKLGACTVRDSIRIDYVPSIQVNLGADRTVCAGDTLLLRTSPGIPHHWQDGSTDDTFLVTGPGVYWAEATNGCQTIRDSVRVDYTTPPVVALGSDTVLNAHESLTLSVSQPDAIYYWQDGSVDSTFTVVQPGTYWVTVQNRCGVASDTITVRHSDIQPPPDSLPIPPADSSICSPEDFPNVITPNGDGKNDTFQINCPAEQNWQLTIYNRWGKTLFRRDAYRGDWNAEGISNGMYFYTLANPSGYSVKGVIHVLR